MIEKQSVVLSVGDSVWFINSRYLKDSIGGMYNEIFEDYVPLYFNENIAFVQFIMTEISYLPVKIDNFEGSILYDLIVHYNHYYYCSNDKLLLFLLSITYNYNNIITAQLKKALKKSCVFNKEDDYTFEMLLFLF